jgi:pentatricopeptide repeat protein
MKEKNIKMNAGTYIAMIRVVGQTGGDVDSARRLFEEMKEKNIEMNAGTYNAMIGVVGEIGGDVDGARRVCE